MRISKLTQCFCLDLQNVSDGRKDVSCEDRREARHQLRNVSTAQWSFGRARGCYLDACFHLNASPDVTLLVARRLTSQPLEDWEHETIIRILGHRACEVDRQFSWKVLAVLLPQSRSDHLYERLWKMLEPYLVTQPLSEFGDLFCYSFSSWLPRKLLERYNFYEDQILDRSEAFSSYAQRYLVSKQDENSPELKDLIWGNILKHPADYEIFHQALAQYGPLEPIEEKVSYYGLKWQLETLRPDDWTDNWLWSQAMKRYCPLRFVELLQQMDIAIPSAVLNQAVLVGNSYNRSSLLSCNYQALSLKFERFPETHLLWSQSSRMHFPQRAKEMAVAINISMRRLGVPKDLINLITALTMNLWLRELQRSVFGSIDCR